MLEESKNLIIKNFLTLMKECDVEVLKTLMVEKSVFTQKELDKIFSTNDQRHNKRVFFFNIQKKEQRTFIVLIECLRQTNQNYIANLLQPLECEKVFKQMLEENETDDEAIQNRILLPISTQPQNLIIRVQPSENFHDSLKHNKHLEYYSTRSKKRGRFLIINNYKFSTNAGGYRKGAEIDNNNLTTLFKQMGGWEIIKEENKTATEMETIIKNFASDNINSQYDISLVIILSHGNEEKNDTIIYGIDENYIFASFVIKQFTNEYCRSWRDKPKIIMFQVCRGEDLDFSIRHTTETDSMKKKEPEILPQPIIHAKPIPLVDNIRSQEDIVVCYSTLSGYKSHRNPYRGCWYIEILCEKIMNFAHNTSFDDILMLVDQGLKRRMSEWSSMQTTEHSYRGFNKKLYLHPGIYFEDDTVKKFFT